MTGFIGILCWWEGSNMTWNKESTSVIMQICLWRTIGHWKIGDHSLIWMEEVSFKRHHLIEALKEKNQLVKRMKGGNVFPAKSIAQAQLQSRCGG